MKNVIVIGNKPYRSLDLNRIIDGFDSNYRCNMAMIENNNGTKRDNLGLCNHLYERLISDPYDLKGFIDYYKEFYREEYIEDFFEDFQRTKHEYNRVFYAEPRTSLYNHFLKSAGCPFTFSKRPRTGFAIMMENLLSNNAVSVVHFSIHNEVRVTSYVKEGHYESECHSMKEELEIFRWLHKNEIVDATLCLLEDSNPPVLIYKGLSPSNKMMTKLNNEFTAVLREEE